MKNPTVCICRALCIADHRELSAESIGCQIEAVTKEQLVYGLLWLCCCRSFSHCGEEQSYNMQRAEVQGFFFLCVCVIPLLLLVITAVTPFPGLTHLPTRQHSSGIVELCAGRFFGELQW